MSKISFTKMQGAGNDFIVIEDLENQHTQISTLAATLCDRHFSIGADGILVVRKSNIADIQMVIINGDGSYASMCGNGIRCFAKYVWEQGLVEGEQVTIETGDGIKTVQLAIEENTVKKVRVNMGLPSFELEKIPAVAPEKIFNQSISIENKTYHITSMRMGVPHTVVIGEHATYKVEEGKHIERHPWFPEGTNVNFCEVVNTKKVKVKTWERGAGATLACGTGSCASVIAAHELGRIEPKAIVEVPGGTLEIEITEEGVFMTGPAEVAFKGEVEVSI